MNDTSSQSAVTGIVIRKNPQDSSMLISWRSAVTGDGFIVFKKAPGETEFTAVSPLLHESSYTEKELAMSGTIYFVRSFYNGGSFKDSEPANFTE